jgi:hypothetical protein
LQRRIATLFSARRKRAAALYLPQRANWKHIATRLHRSCPENCNRPVLAAVVSLDGFLYGIACVLRGHRA